MDQWSRCVSWRRTNLNRGFAWAERGHMRRTHRGAGGTERGRYRLWCEKVGYLKLRPQSASRRVASKCRLYTRPYRRAQCCWTGVRQGLRGWLGGRKQTERKDEGMGVLTINKAVATQGGAQGGGFKIVQQRVAEQAMNGWCKKERGAGLCDVVRYGEARTPFV